MKKLRSLFALLTVLAMMLVLAGCGDTPAGTDPTETDPTETSATAAPTTEATEPPLTAEQVFSAVSAAMANAEATHMGMTINYSMTYSESEGDISITGEIAYGMVMDIIISEDPFGSYVYTEVAMDMDGYSFTLDMDIYLTEEDGSVVSYTQFFGAWDRTDYEMSPEDYLENDTDTDISTEGIWSGGEVPADLTLDDGTQDLDGTEVYVLRCSISAEGMDEIFTNMGLEVAADMTELSMPVVYYVDAETFTVLRMEADMQFLAGLLGDTLAEAILGTDVDGVTFDLQMEDLVYDLGYGAQDIPAVPQEAYDYIANQETYTGDEEDENGNTADLGNGQFTMGCGSETVLITCPEGWSGEIFTPANVWIFNDDYSLIGDYYYLEGYTEDDIISYFVQNTVSYMETMEFEFTSGESVSIDGYTTMEVISDGESFYYAWREAGDGWLLVYVYDYSGTDDATELLPQMINCVSPYTE